MISVPDQPERAQIREAIRAYCPYMYTVVLGKGEGTERKKNNREKWSSCRHNGPPCRYSSHEKVTNVSHSFLLAKTANNKDAKPRTGLVLLCNVRFFMKQCRPDANLHSDAKEQIIVCAILTHK